MHIASMPMYDIPEVRSALDSFWEGMARNFRREGITEVPEKLVHGRAIRKLWNDPGLFISQCCGYDVVNRYADKLVPLAAPRYGVPECRGYLYASVIVVRDDCVVDDVLKMRGAVCVINGPESHSGMSSLRALVAPFNSEGRFFSQVRVSGSHAESIRILRKGEADVAAIDCVTYALLERYRPAALADLRKLGRTHRAPGIPYVTRASVDAVTKARMRTAIALSFVDPRLADVRQALFLKGIDTVRPAAYRRITVFQERATHYGYPVLT
jgi:ABC-type phosphate/phosphonate transport system substrate-binding protein